MSLDTSLFSFTGATIVATFLAGAVGCSPAVPDNPTWTEDVRPILMANCVRCHTNPPIGGAPDYIRLDSYDDWPLDNGGAMAGAAAFAGAIASFVANEEDPMPPEIGPLPERQQELLRRWAEQGAPRGEPLPGNQAPAITMEPGVVDAAAGTVTFAYEIRDPDEEFVLGTLAADDTTITYELHSGPGEVVWDISAVPAGTYQLSAELDDGNERFAVDLGSIDIPAAAGLPAGALHPLFPVE